MELLLKMISHRFDVLLRFEFRKIIMELIGLSRRVFYAFISIDFTTDKTSNQTLLYIVYDLIKYKFDIFQYGMRPILMAAWHGHTDAVQMLINYGASVNTINKVSLNNYCLIRILSIPDLFLLG